LVRFFVGIVSGVLASFALTILAEYILYTATPAIFRIFFPQLLVVALAVGALVGLIVRNRTKIAAGLSLAPWAIYLILAANGNHATIREWVIAVAIISIDVALAMGVAALVNARIIRSSAQS